MEKIDIQINQATLKGIYITFPDHKNVPDVVATISLLCDKEEIGTFIITTERCGGLKFELPAKIIESIVKMRKEIECIFVKEFKKDKKESKHAESEERV